VSDSGIRANGSLGKEILKPLAKGGSARYPASADLGRRELSCFEKVKRLPFSPSYFL
jgi:hypothetical protein